MADERQIPPAMAACFKRTFDIQEVTEDQLVRTLWQWADEGKEERIDIVVQARVAWKSELEDDLSLGIGWIRPTPYDPVRSGPGFELGRVNEVFRDYGAGIPLPKAASAEEAEPHLREVVQRANLMTDSLSFLTGFPARWRPARILRTSNQAQEARYGRYCALPPDDQQSAAVVDDDFMTVGYPAFLQMLWEIRPSDFREALLSAISWQAQGNYLQGLGQYVHYWASVELLGSYLFAQLPSSELGRPPASELRQAILENLLDVSSDNYMDVARRCSELLRPSIRTVIKAVGRVVGIDANPLFRRPDRETPSLYEIRNDIAHGVISHRDRDYMIRNKAQLERYRRTTANFIFQVLKTSPKLAELMAVGRGATDSQSAD